MFHHFNCIFCRCKTRSEIVHVGQFGQINRWCMVCRVLCLLVSRPTSLDFLLIFLLPFLVCWVFFRLANRGCALEGGVLLVESDHLQYSLRLVHSAYSGDFAKIFVHFIKLFLDFNLNLYIPLLYRICRLSFSNLDLSKSALIVHRIFGDAIVAFEKFLWRGVLFRHPVIKRQDSFSAMSTFFA